MDLNLLSLFTVVAETDSFSAAASKLGLRRSSISRGVAALERSLGVQLFSRTTRHVALTTAGKALYAKVAPQLVALKDALGTLPEREEQPSGELRLTAPTDIGDVVLPGILAGFTLRYPGVRVDVRLTNRVVDLVAEGFDVALRIASGKLADSSLVAKRLSELELQVFGSPEYLSRAGMPRAPSELAEHTWVSFRGAKTPSRLQLHKAKTSILGDDILFIHESVRAGVGLGVLPTFLTQKDVAAGTLLRVLPRVCIQSGVLYLVHPPSQHVPRKISAFRDYLVDYFAAHPLRAK